VVLGKIICPIGGTWAPKDVELALLLAVTEPIEVHVHSLGMLLLDSAIGNPAGVVVVGLEWGGWLGVAQFMQSSPNGTKGLSIKE